MLHPSQILSRLFLRCVEDVDLALGNMSLPFHSIGFNMIGFAKIKYILNGLALEKDIIFLDTDIVVR